MPMGVSPHDPPPPRKPARQHSRGIELLIEFGDTWRRSPTVTTYEFIIVISEAGSPLGLQGLRGSCSSPSFRCFLVNNISIGLNCAQKSIQV